MLMDQRMRAATDKFAAHLMADKLNELGVDLTDATAVREALRSARFGEQLIENCAEDAAERARLLRSH